ncbi:hypothetical protein GCM10023176_07270 [Micromonospora coerulea]|uniref:Uncharacterized protein n=1 Tax=Micromonospora coerulea TaxID=47856 RepID=A0ABP8S7A4_9ACTN
MVCGDGEREAGDAEVLDLADDPCALSAGVGGRLGLEVHPSRATQAEAAQVGRRDLEVAVLRRVPIRYQQVAEASDNAARRS